MALFIQQAKILITGNKLTMKNLPYLNSAVIIGIILFQSIFIAPSINQLISTNEAAVFLRYIWPIFFIIIGLLSLISFISILKNKNQNSVLKIYIVISLILMLSCFFAVPFINNAKDLENELLWSILHMKTVFFTLISLILNVLIVFKWNFSSVQNGKN
ncbi:MAG: hypothetical protein CMD16_00255 [Flavobacteriales bacterium]|nr:hypothetical protein [Flavobacteriales bacterium]|tara:strand:- start:4757 stop:5233 length:477 start_codon:yes stop_codon:yes gene_type:complete